MCSAEVVGRAASAATCRNQPLPFLLNTRACFFAVFIAVATVAVAVIDVVVTIVVVVVVAAVSLGHRPHPPGCRYIEQLRRMEAGLHDANSAVTPTAPITPMHCIQLPVVRKSDAEVSPKPRGIISFTLHPNIFLLRLEFVLDPATFTTPTHASRGAGAAKRMDPR